MLLPDSRFSLTTEPERFNDLAWDLLLRAQEEARRWRHGEMDVQHLVLALLDEQRLRPLLNPLRLQGPELRDDLEDFCARQPTRSSNTLYVGDDLELLLDLAEQERQQQGAASIDERHLRARAQEPPPLPRVPPVHWRTRLLARRAQIAPQEEARGRRAHRRLCHRHSRAVTARAPMRAPTRAIAACVL